MSEIQKIVFPCVETMCGHFFLMHSLLTMKKTKTTFDETTFDGTVNAKKNIETVGSWPKLAGLHKTVLF